MAYLDRDGVRVYYEVRGDGPVLLLTHGFAGSANTWRPNVDALAERNRVVVWELRGHGRTDAPDDPSAYSEELTVGDMAALLDAVGVERAVIGGHSFGGYASLLFHLAHRDRVAGLVLFGCGPGYRSDDGRRGWNGMVEALAAGLDEGGLDALWDGLEVDRELNRSAPGLSRAARGMLTQRDASVIDSLETIDVPTLIVVGERDEQFAAAATYMAKKVPDATHVVIPGAGHAANIEQPDAFNDAVTGFLSTT
jgi:pimeloyl-ACP methyl ester carboxylesterase